jgi:hypothetical protein
MRSARTFGVYIIFLSTLAMAQSPSIPTIEQPLVPATAQPGGAGFTLTINGVGFNPRPTAVLWGEGTTVTHLTITGSTATQLTATVPAANIGTAGTSSVSVLNLAGIASNVEFFQIATPASPQFAAPVDYGTGTSDAVQTVLTADFNGDGILDLAVGVLNDPSQVCILLGSSNGTFQSPTCYQVDDVSSIVAGRFRNDGGSIDLVAGDTLLVGNGDGTFQPPTSLLVGVGGFRPFAVGDFSQTGVLGIAGLIGTNVQILANNGSGTFSAGQNFSSGVTAAAGMLTADFNGDGILDLAVLDTYFGSPAVRVFLGSAEGFSGGNALVTTTPVGSFAFTAADFNGDNKQDIALAYNPSDGGGDVLILNGNGDGTFASGFSQPLANVVTGAIVTGDFNEDGNLDLATGTYILQGKGDGTFQTPTSFGGTAEVLATGDFNGDGRPDLVAQASPDVAILLQQAGVPIVSLKPTSLNFSSQTVGTTSAAQAVTLTNSGGATLTITSIGFTGPNASEFAQTSTSTCGSSLAADSSCTINVTFTPTANGGSGSATASLSVADNAAASPQTVPITGTVRNFSLTTTCTSLTVVPGQTAIFTVDLAPVNGFAQLVSLSCSGAPALATCTVSPNSITLDGSTTVQAKVTATTTKATGFLQFPVGRSNGNRMAGLAGLAGIAGLAALVVLPGKRGVKPRRRLCGLIFLLCMLAILVTLPSCAGGGGDPPGTAAGTYPLTVTGTFQSATETAITESVSFNLVVQ